MSQDDRILNLLLRTPRDEWVNARFIRQALGLSEASLTKHLKRLRESGLIEFKAIAKYGPKSGSYKDGGPAKPWHYRLNSTQRAKQRRRLA